MSRQITQPLNQVRLTNVAVVRLSRAGHRFEVACYRNKIVNYRQGTETDLSEVLQTERVFANVSKGQFANAKALKKAFGTSDEEEICRRILDKGDVQVTDRERAAGMESTLREVSGMVAEKCVHPVTRRPYTVAQVRDAMKAAGFMVHPARNAKQQFLECVKVIQKKGVLEIERAKMKLALVLLEDDDGGDGDDCAERREVAINRLVEEGVARSDVEKPRDDSDARIVFQSDPSLYRKVEAIAREPSVRGRLEIVQQCVTEEGDATLGSELERRAQQQQQQQQQQQHAKEESKRAPLANKDGEEGAPSPNEDVRSLATELQSASLGDDDDDIVPAHRLANSRKAQKAAQKKSKKAKRREKEERAEREQRIAAEKERRREREERLGTSAVGAEGGGGGEAMCPVAGVGGVGDRGSAAGGGPGSDGRPCNTCGGSFAPSEYRSHFRSDWHRYNVKLKMGGGTPVSEEEFRLCDADCLF
ncbi:hypothetical protein ACHAWF_002232 [Thalassiosira exigua]